MLFTTLSNQNQSISIPYPSHVYDKQRKKHFSVVIGVCCMLCYEIFLSQNGVFQCSTGCIKEKNFVANNGDDLW